MSDANGTVDHRKRQTDEPTNDGYGGREQAERVAMVCRRELMRGTSSELIVNRVQVKRDFAWAKEAGWCGE